MGDTGHLFCFPMGQWIFPFRGRVLASSWSCQASSLTLLSPHCCHSWRSCRTPWQAVLQPACHNFPPAPTACRRSCFSVLVCQDAQDASQQPLALSITDRSAFLCGQHITSPFSLGTEQIRFPAPPEASPYPRGHRASTATSQGSPCCASATETTG